MNQQNTAQRIGPEELEEGDIITVSERVTTMEVESVQDNAIGGKTVTATNQHGQYRLRYHTDESWTLRISGRLIAGGVEVTKVDG